jgi:integrase
MGRGDGVEKRPSSIRLFFVDQHGQEHRETLKINGVPLKPTSANLAHASRLAAQIRKEVALGTFNLAEHFPHSKRAAAAPAHTFGVLGDNWLATQSDKTPATRSQYKNALEFWKKKLGADTPIAELTHERLASAVGKHRWPTAKLRNNYLIALRGPLGLHYHGRKSLDNPMIGIKNARVVRKAPDPLTAAERDLVLADMRKHYDARVWCYFVIAFFTGMRPEEIIALRWEDVDWRKGTIRVQRVRTFKGSEREGSKTHSWREVDLVPVVLEALQAMKQFTFLKRNDEGAEVDLLENPVTKRPWHDERSQRDHYWKPTLKRLGIRWRRAYATRHTFCTVALMGGVRPAYIAQQAGHSVKMLLDTYARWIPDSDGGIERARLAAALTAPTSPQLPQLKQG